MFSIEPMFPGMLASAAIAWRVELVSEAVGEAAKGARTYC
jgi:hypothetical protein